MIDDEPTSECDENIYYKYCQVDYYAAMRKDIHYGLVGGEIYVTFHKG